MQGKDLLQLAEQFGTPLYVYDAEKIQSQFNRLTKAFSKVEKLRINYAMKALSNISILQLLKDMGSGLDTVSIQEVLLGLHAGYAPEKIFYTPNGVSLEEIEEVNALGVQINIDNLSILEQFGTKHPNVPVCIRINPHVMAGGNTNISVGHIDSKFGISIHQLRHIQRVIKSTGLVITGLHMHTGSEIKDIDVFIRSLEILLNIAHEFPDLTFLDLGSGFKVPYQDGDYTTDLVALATKIQETISKFEQEENRKFELWFEPGKFLVSEAGYFVTKANVIKQTTATTFVGVNTGFNHLIRPMFYESYHHIINLSNPKGVERIYTVVGNLCETDTFCWDRVLNEVREGDYLMFKNAGAYGFEMASSFNSRMRPAEILFSKGKHHLIRKRETLDDLLTNQVEVL